MSEQDITREVEQVLAQKELSTEEKRVRLLGRKGVLTLKLRELGQLDKKARAKQGQLLNELKAKIDNALSSRPIKETKVDLTAPAVTQPIGSIHPLNQTLARMVELFSHLGFETVTGPEIVSDEDNFGSLHFPLHHPARDTQDSFMIDQLPGYLLRTQTSAMQVPAMKQRTPPMRVIVPGKTFRREADATHQPMFHQLEGFIVDEEVTFSDLKGLLRYFCELYFGVKTPMRFRSHYFPFTEPSAEVDILWTKENGEQKWLEILGCGCIHPTVLENAGINPKKYQGVAFGLGVERPFMLAHGLDDMRQLYLNNEEFLNQFSA